uniref:Uncharacterized protein n=1 Tax=Trichuris muris TaxID=70415 RepID=A0A5S6R2T2_TRIMR
MLPVIFINTSQKRDRREANSINAISAKQPPLKSGRIAGGLLTTIANFNRLTGDYKERRIIVDLPLPPGAIRDGFICRPISAVGKATRQRSSSWERQKVRDDS